MPVIDAAVRSIIVPDMMHILPSDPSVDNGGIGRWQGDRTTNGQPCLNDLYSSTKYLKTHADAPLSYLGPNGDPKHGKWLDVRFDQNIEAARAAI